MFVVRVQCRYVCMGRLQVCIGCVVSVWVLVNEVVSGVGVCGVGGMEWVLEVGVVGWAVFYVYGWVSIVMVALILKGRGAHEVDNGMVIIVFVMVMEGVLCTYW